MKGIDYANSGYRRMYPPTPAFKLLGCKAQTVYWALRTMMDPSGFFKLCGCQPAEALAVELGWAKKDRAMAERGLETLLEQGWIHYLEDEDALFDPCFFESEHAKKSGKLRAKEYRQRSQDSKVQEFEERSRAARTQVEEGTSRKTAPLRAVAALEPKESTEPRERRIGFQASGAEMGSLVPLEGSVETSTSSPSSTTTASLSMPPTAYASPVHATTSPSAGVTTSPSPPVVTVVTGSSSSEPVTKRTSASHAVTERASASRPVTPRHEALPYSLIPTPYSQEQAAARDPASREGARARAAPTSAPSTEPAAAAEMKEDPAFTEYAERVAALFEKAVGTARLFNPAEGELIADWYKRGIDLRVIAETLPEKAKRALKPVQTLLYFQEAVPEVWARERDLKACVLAHQDSPIDFEAHLATLVTLLQGVPTLAEQVAALKGQAQRQPDQVESTLRALEEQFLDAMELTDAQVEDLRRALAHLSERMTAEDLARQRVRLARQIKLDALGIPALSLYSPEVTNPGPSQEPSLEKET